MNIISDKYILFLLNQLLHMTGSAKTSNFSNQSRKNHLPKRVKIALSNRF